MPLGGYRADHGAGDIAPTRRGEGHPALAGWNDANNRFSYFCEKREMVFSDFQREKRLRSR
ncbi:MAG: hypothetical protein RSD68_07930, partial [Oscillospiraceae bacterium]